MGGRPEAALRDGMICVYEPGGLVPPEQQGNEI